jgi:hypothetical protein
MTEDFDHIIHVYGRPSEAPSRRFDHELQAGEVIEWDGVPMRVVGARSEDRDYGRVRIVHLEPLTKG